MNWNGVKTKMKAHPVGSLAVVLLMAVLAILYFRWMGLAQHQQRHDVVSGNWFRMESDLFKNSVNLQAHLAKVEAISQDVEERLIRPAELARNYQYFYRMETQTGVKIENLQQLPPTVSAQPQTAGQASVLTPPGSYSKIGYNLSVGGGFHEVLAFLHALENGLHISRIKSFSLQRAGDVEKRSLGLSLQLELLGEP